MKSYICIIGLFLAYNLNGQLPNGFKIDTTIDDFTGAITVKTSNITFNHTALNPYPIFFKIYKYEGALAIAYTICSNSILIVEKDQLLQFKFRDGEIISLPNGDFSMSDGGSLCSGMDYDISLITVVTKEQLIKFTEEPLIKIRINGKSGVYDIEPSSEERQRELMACVGAFVKAVSN